MNVSGRWLIRKFGSLPVAVVLLLALAAYISYGTFIESYYKDSQRASYYVYQSPIMWFLLWLLGAVLLAVMIDRWPWKRRHWPFLLAHGGIIVVLLGAFFTYLWGLDGIMILTPGQATRYVQLESWQLSVYSSFDGEKFAKLYDWSGSLFGLDLNRKKLKLPLSVDDEIEFVQWYPYVVYSKKYRRSPAIYAKPAVQLRIGNNQFSESFWLFGSGQGSLSPSVELGPVKVTFGQDRGPDYPVRKQIYVWLKDEKTLYYLVYSDTPSQETLKGEIKVGQKVPLPWMNLELEILQLLPKAEEVYDVEVLNYKTNNSVPGLQVRYKNQLHWLFASEALKLFSDNFVIVITLNKYRQTLDFSLTLKEFRIRHWPQSWQASSYESDVIINDQGPVYTIKMNEPLKYKGYTFYQSSYHQDSAGRIVASILSVNRDPGRPLKYVGSFILVLGIILLFYDKRKVLYVQIQRQKV